MAGFSLHMDANIAYNKATMRSERRGEKTKGSSHDLSMAKSGIALLLAVFYRTFQKKST